MHEFFRLRIRPWGLLTAVGFLGCVGSVAGFLGQFAWWADIGSHFRPQYVALFSVLGICYFVGRKRLWAAAAFAMAAANALPILFFLLPARPFDTPPGRSLKAVLVNVNTLRGQPEAVAQFLREESPDIIVLEEINAEWVQLLSPVLQSYPVQWTECREDNFGIGLFAKTQKTAVRKVPFGSAGVPSLVADMQFEGRPFRLLATHPLPPGGPEYSRYRNEQLREVAEFIRVNEGPLVVLGDLNVSPWSAHYRGFIRRSGLRNSSEGRALHATWPTFSPLLRIPIDHCLQSKGIGIASKRVGRDVGSDHYPLIVEFFLDHEMSARP